MKVGIVTQARSGSSRLPGKVLKTIEGKSLLEYHLERLQLSSLPIIVATTEENKDDEIVEWCNAHNYHVVRGSEANVLARFYKAAKAYNLDHIVRVTSDCPLIDGKLIAEGVEKYLELNSKDTYYTNTQPRSFPRGFDFEIFSMEMLEAAQNFAESPFDKEHVTPYFYDTNKANYNIVGHSQNKDFSHLRITVDEQADFQLIEKLITEYSANMLGYGEIQKLLDNSEALQLINKHVEQKKF